MQMWCWAWLGSLCVLRWIDQSPCSWRGLLLVHKIISCPQEDGHPTLTVPWLGAADQLLHLSLLVPTALPALVFLHKPPCVLMSRLKEFVISVALFSDGWCIMILAFLHFSGILMRWLRGALSGPDGIHPPWIHISLSLFSGMFSSWDKLIYLTGFG